MSALSRWLRGREGRQGIGGDPDCLIVKPWHTGYNNTESYGMAAKAFDRQKYGKPEEIIHQPGNSFIKEFILNQLEIKRNNIFSLFQCEATI